MSLTLDETHEDRAVTLAGFARVLRSMRYEDIAAIASHLELIRRGGEWRRTSRSITANDVIALTDEGVFE